MFQYDATYDPPAPTARVTFARAGDGPATIPIEAQMLVDTGADISLIPRAVADAINAVPTERTMDAMSFDGHRSSRPIVAATMHLGKYRMNVGFLVHDEGETTGIIGRNILNHLYVVLDRPAGIWSLGRANRQDR